MFYIYIYFDPSRDLEPIYVGKGKGKRAEDHLKRKDRHPFTHRLQKMKKNGIDPIIETYECDTEEAAFQLERELISTIGRKDLGKGPLLNLTDGGEGITGLIITEEHRANLSVTMKGKKRPNVSAALKGKNFTEERKANVSAALKSSEEFQKVMKTPEYKARLSAARKGKPRPDVSAALKGKPQEIVICPHCGKAGGKPGMTRYHFDNCKDKLLFL